MLKCLYLFLDLGVFIHSCMLTWKASWIWKKKVMVHHRILSALRVVFLQEIIPSKKIMVPRQSGLSDLLWIKKEHLACGKVLQGKCFMVIVWTHTSNDFSCTCNWRVALSLGNLNGAAFLLNFHCVWGGCLIIYIFIFLNSGAHLFFGSFPCPQKQPVSWNCTSVPL